MYSGIPPRALATASSEMRQASPTGFPLTISVAIEEQAIATAQPMHLNLMSSIMPRAIRRVINTVSLSTGLLTRALADGFSRFPTFRGAA